MRWIDGQLIIKNWTHLNVLRLSKFPTGKGARMLPPAISRSEALRTDKFSDAEISSVDVILDPMLDSRLMCRTLVEGVDGELFFPTPLILNCESAFLALATCF